MPLAPGSPSYWREADQLQASPLWDMPSPSGSDFDALAPINFDFDNTNNDQFDFFDALPPRPNSPPALLHSSTNHIIIAQDSSASSNQQAFRHRNDHPSEYRIQDSSSPDPFSGFLLPASPPAQDRGRAQTRASSVVDLTVPSPKMAPSRKRKLEEAGSSSAPNPKREPIRRSARTATPKSDEGSIEVVDLEKVEGQKDYEDFQAKQRAEAIRKQNEDAAKKPVRLADFQCIICMDNPTDLTVTHCGHLFCSECLHSALNAGDKRCCPVCRTPIGMPKPGSHNKPPKNGAFVLEMKLMTANKKGKQPALN